MKMEKFIKLIIDNIADLFGLVGVVLVSVGLFKIGAVLGLIGTGIILILIGYAISRKGV